MQGEQRDVLGTRPSCNRVSPSVPPALDRNIFQPKTCALTAAEVFSNYLALMAMANTHRALKGYQNTICGPAARISRA